MAGRPDLVDRDERLKALSSSAGRSPVKTGQTKKTSWRSALIGVVALAALVHVTAAVALSFPPTQTEEFTIPGADPGISLYLRNKHLAMHDSFRGIVLLVHGGTYPGESFDVIFDGVDCPGAKPLAPAVALWSMEEDPIGIKWRSWMDYHATSGFDVYFIDIRGYGRSTKPHEMNEPADKNPPVVRTDVAARDLAVAVDFILKRRNVQRLDLIGSAWGSVLAAGYAVQHPERVERLVLQSPIWLRAPRLSPRCPTLSRRIAL
jgi:pimeloyl-ACP methyl ester carboxylesterase